MSLGSIIGGVGGGIAGFFMGGPIGAFYGFSIGFAGGMLVDPMTPDTPSIGVPDPDQQVMSATIGDPVSDLCGTSKIIGHLLLYGLERAEAIYSTSEAPGGKGGPPEPQPQVTGYKYYMTWALGICAGPINTIYAIYRQEDVVWEGELNIPTSGGQETIVIESMGTATFYFGSDDQIANTKIGAVLTEQGIDINLNSPLRHLCWCVFEDCYIGDYNRTPNMHFVIKKIPDTPLPTDRAAIQEYDMNPMHVVYYILNTLCGLPVSWINDDDFESVAETIYLESRGVSVLFNNQQSGLDYIQTITNHIDGLLRYGADAQFHPKLIRDDYDIEAIPHLTESETLDDPSFTRKSWIDTINETKVQYTELIATRPHDVIKSGAHIPDSLYAISWSRTLGTQGLGRYVIGAYISEKLYYSDDGGFTWIETVNPTGSYAKWISWFGPEAGSTFMLPSGGYMGLSADGINWTLSNKLPSGSFGNVAWNKRNGKHVTAAVAGGTSYVYTSSDNGQTWDQGQSVSVYTSYKANYEMNDGYHYLIGFNYDQFWRSEDLITWEHSPNTPFAFATVPLRNEAKSDGNIVAYQNCYGFGSAAPWQSNGGVALTKVDWNDKTKVWACVNNYNIHKSGQPLDSLKPDGPGDWGNPIDTSGVGIVGGDWVDIVVGDDRIVAIKSSSGANNVYIHQII